MRGKAGIAALIAIFVGITPAYAGKSFSVRLPLKQGGDHPRLCGEKAAFRFSVEICLGSPPPMRGKVVCLLRIISGGRITPAYAGKSVRCTVSRKCSRDHPRLCGEKFANDRYIYIKIGSPPPMRGKGKLENSIKTTTRITPAYAGKRTKRSVGKSTA